MPASPGCSVRSRSSSCLRGSFFGDDPVLDVGPVEAGHEVPGVAAASAGRRSRRGWPWSRSRSARCGARRASARAASTARGSRAGSRGPTGPRSAPRRWRTARSCRGRAAAGWPDPQPLRRQVEQVELAGEERAPRPRGRSSRSWVELRKPARTPERRQRVDLVLHQRDQRRDDHARRPARTSAGIW